MDDKESKSEETEDDFFVEMRECFEASRAAEQDNHQRYEADVKFGRLGEQWDDVDVDARKKESRPTLTVNRMPSFIRQVVNDARQNKPQIKVHPDDSEADPETAQVLNGIIRNIEQVSKADLAYDTAIDCAASGGFGYFRIDLEYAHEDTFDMDIRINRIVNPLTVYGDPNCVDADSANWKTAFEFEDMPTDEYEERFPDAEVISFSEADATSQGWKTEDTVRVAKYWVREEIESTLYRMSDGSIVSEETYETLKEEYEDLGNTVVDSRKTSRSVVTMYLVNGQEVLEETPWPGKYIPIIPVYGEEIYAKDQRHLFSLIHFSKDSQKMFNYWRSTTTELVALAPKSPWVGAVGSFETDSANWQSANTQNHAYLEYDPVTEDGLMAPPPQRQPFAGPPAGALQEALNASDDMKSVMGLHDAALGAQSNEISGIAIGKRVREGDTSTFHFVDNMARSIRHAGVCLVDLIPKVKSKESIERILGEDGTAQTVRINGEITKEEEMLQGEAIERKEAIDRIYDLNVGRYDVTVKAGPSYTTQREESRDSMLTLLQAFPQAASVTGDLIVESMDWPNADAFAKRLKSLLPPGVLDEKQDPQVGQMQQQMKGMEQVINQLMADREGKQAEIQVDNRKVDIDQMNAETKRMEAGIKEQEAKIKLMEAQKPDTPPAQDNSAIILKTMDIEEEQRQSAIDAHFKQQEIDIENANLVLEEQKLNLAKYQTDHANNSVDVAPVTTPPAPQASPVQVFNVEQGNKNIGIQRNEKGEIVGATVVEQ